MSADLIIAGCGLAACTAPAVAQLIDSLAGSRWLGTGIIGGIGIAAGVAALSV